MELDFLQLGTMGVSHILFGCQMKRWFQKDEHLGLWDHPGQSTDDIFDILFTPHIQSFVKPIHSFFPVFPIFHLLPSFITTTIKSVHWDNFNGILNVYLHTYLNCKHFYQRTLPFLQSMSSFHTYSQACIFSSFNMFLKNLINFQSCFLFLAFLIRTRILSF